MVGYKNLWVWEWCAFFCRGWTLEAWNLLLAGKAAWMFNPISNNGHQCRTYFSGLKLWNHQSVDLWANLLSKDLRNVPFARQRIGALWKMIADPPMVEIKTQLRITSVGFKLVPYGFVWKCWVNIPNEIAIFHRDPRDNDHENHWV